MSASCCLPKFSARSYGRVYLHNWLLFTHSHTSSHRFQLSAFRPVFPHCLPENCLDFLVAGDNAIRQYFPVLSEAAALRAFPLAMLTLQVGGKSRQCPCPLHGSGNNTLCQGASPQRPTPSSMGTCRPFTELIFLMTSYMHVFISSSSMAMTL